MLKSGIDITKFKLTADISQEINCKLERNASVYWRMTLQNSPPQNIATITL
jgi:hypothetical protein